MLLTTLVDPDNELARVLGYRAIPNGFAFSREGELLGSKITGFDIRSAETRALVEAWIRHERGGDDLRTSSSAEALDLFGEGSRLMRAGRRDDALALWAQAYEKDPWSFVIRKQIWRALYPERFGDPIDLAWQKEQIAREDEIGFRSANPGLPAAVRLRG